MRFCCCCCYCCCFCCCCCVAVVVDPKKLPLKFGQNWVINRWDFVIVVVVVVVLLLLLLIPKNLPLKFGQNLVSNSWDIADVEFLSGGWGGVKSYTYQTHLRLGFRLSWGWVGVWTFFFWVSSYETSTTRS